MNQSRPDLSASAAPDGKPSTGPPPIPPRAARAASQYGAAAYSPYMSGPGYGMGNGMYGSAYGGYPGFARYGGGGMYDTAFDQESALLRVADEASRPAFQSIESIVQAVGAISMMLESSYSAVYNSFRAVIGVADHFVRLKTQLFNVLATLSIFRSLRMLLRKLLRFLRLRAQTTDDDIWSDISDATQKGTDGAAQQPKSSWPFILFFALISVGPWLIWRLLASIMAEDQNGWASGKSEHYLAMALYDFTAENDDELSFRTGQQILIAPKERQPRTRGWMLASVDGQKIGLVPQNYINILGKRKPITPVQPSAASCDPPPSLPLAEFTSVDEKPKKSELCESSHGAASLQPAVLDVTNDGVQSSS